MTQVNTQNGRVLPDLSQLSQAQMIQMLLDAQTKIEKLEAAPKHKVTCKVSEKGACSVYHGSRFPVTLYRQQWLTILAAASEIEAFLKANASKLPLKGE